MTFTVEKFTIVEYEGKRRPVHARVSAGLVFTVDEGWPAIDVSGRRMHRDIYNKYFKQPEPELEAEPEQEEE